jgi:asparagine synthase (glutamine-hydrolysing)
MCSIAGMLHLLDEQIPNIQNRLNTMNRLQAHRGPDGEGVWVHADGHVGLAHRRLSIIGISTGAQPMQDAAGNWVCFNGEIYNYLELRAEIGGTFRTESDTEVILASWQKWGTDCVNHFNGMFSFVLWDETDRKLFCARDRFGVKPFYYTVQNNVFYFASEIKALLPFLPDIDTDLEGFKEYLFFQFCLQGRTMFKDVQELLPAYHLIIDKSIIKTNRYWQIYYSVDFNHTQRYFEDAIRSRFEESLQYHIRSEVPIGGYVSGGVDSSIVSSIASGLNPGAYMGFTGKFNSGALYDESAYARLLAQKKGFALQEVCIGPNDFIKYIEDVIYHLDNPVAGPGSFSQYMVSQLAAKHRKVVLGGQGGDEIFGGYARYLVAYLEQCLKGAIEGTAGQGSYGPYIVTMASVIPNLTTLRQYQPMLKTFWSQGLFENSDKRYFQLINRAPDIGSCIHWDHLEDYNPFESYSALFNAQNVERESYFDQMTHFDLKTLLPALLQVEDRMSMAHGIESRVPFLDHKLVELTATIPANMKFKDGCMKYILRQAMRKYVPDEIMDRKDKMGFPTPFTEWAKKETHDFIFDILSSLKARQRSLVNNIQVVQLMEKENNFGRNLWGMFCVELWQRQFHDKKAQFKGVLA